MRRADPHGGIRRPGGDECLNEEIFYSRGEAQVVMDWYREVYNQERPHSSLGYRTPAEVAGESLKRAQN